MLELHKICIVFLSIPRYKIENIAIYYYSRIQEKNKTEQQVIEQNWDEIEDGIGLDIIK